MDLRKKTDLELDNLESEIKIEKKRRELLKMSEDELYEIAMANNGEDSKQKAVSATNILLEKYRPSMELIATLKEISPWEEVREMCRNFRFN